MQVPVTDGHLWYDDRTGKYGNPDTVVSACGNVYAMKDTIHDYDMPIEWTSGGVTCGNCRKTGLYRSLQCQST